MNTEQNFVPVGAPIVDERGYPTTAFTIFMRTLFNRTGKEPGVDSAELELLALLGLIQPPPVTRDEIAAQGALGAFGFAPPAPHPDLTDAFLFALTLLRPPPAPTTSGLITAPVVTSEALAANSLVNVWNSSGSVRARKADASDGIGALHEAHGYVSSAFGSGATATVRFAGLVTGLSALVGGPAYLDPASPGGVTSTPNSTSGQINQQVGIAVSTTTMIFAPQPATGL